MELPTCVYCKTQRVKKKGKKYCSVDCYRQEKRKVFPKVEKICEWCVKQFSVAWRFRAARFCSKSCSNSATKRNRIQKICFWCKKEFETIKSNENITKFCSIECFHYSLRLGEEAVVKLTCKNCKKEFEKSYSNRDRIFCSKKCANSGEFNAMYHITKENHPTYGRRPWIYGLTARTDDKVKKMGEKISRVLKQRFNDGLSTHVGVSNPNFGKTRDDRTIEQLENYSKAAIKRV